MKCTHNLPVFNISNFYDYNKCMEFDSNFYIRTFKDHIQENGFIEKPHGHDFYLLLIVTKGSGTHIIDSQEYKIEKGAMFILSPGQVHQWNLSPDTDGYVLFFTKKYFMQDYTRSQLTKLPFFKSSLSVPYLKLEKNEVEIITNIYKQIIIEYKSHLLDYDAMIRLNLNKIFILLSRTYYDNTIERKTFTYELIQLHRFETLIDSHFKEHKSVSFYANKMNLSLKQLSYLCKKVLDKTPSELLLERIILEAKRLIIHSDMPIAFISDSLNYNDNSYFTRIFKKSCNQTPNQFRNSFAS